MLKIEWLKDAIDSKHQLGDFVAKPVFISAAQTALDVYNELSGKYLETQQVLKEIFELLEEHQPQWYLRKHHNLIKSVLETTQSNFGISRVDLESADDVEIE